MTLKTIIHDGAAVSLDHLAPLTFTCPCRDIGRDLIVGVVFLNHCYTEHFDETKHRKEQIVLYDGGSRPRVFCPIRHGLSVRLPGAVSSLPGKRVFQTPEQRNYVYAVPLELEGQVYEIFFQLQRYRAEGADLRLTVESAYPVENRSPTRRRPQAIRFNVLAYKILGNRPVRFAPR